MFSSYVIIYSTSPHKWAPGHQHAWDSAKEPHKRRGWHHQWTPKSIEKSSSFSNDLYFCRAIFYGEQQLWIPWSLKKDFSEKNARQQRRRPRFWIFDLLGSQKMPPLKATPVSRHPIWEQEHKQDTTFAVFSKNIAKQESMTMPPWLSMTCIRIMEVGSGCSTICFYSHWDCREVLLLQNMQRRPYKYMLFYQHDEPL